MQKDMSYLTMSDVSTENREQMIIISIKNYEIGFQIMDEEAVNYFLNALEFGFSFVDNGDQDDSDSNDRHLKINKIQYLKGYNLQGLTLNLKFNINSFQFLELIHFVKLCPYLKFLSFYSIENLPNEIYRPFSENLKNLKNLQILRLVLNSQFVEKQTQNILLQNITQMEKLIQLQISFVLFDVDNFPSDFYNQLNKLKSLNTIILSFDYKPMGLQECKKIKKFEQNHQYNKHKRLVQKRIDYEIPMDDILDYYDF